MTKTTLLSFLMMMAAVWPAHSQSYGYGFIAPGHETNRGSYFHAGIGGDFKFNRVIGAGGEIGAITGRAFAPNLAVVSGNGSLHIPISVAALDHFATLGVTLVKAGGGDVLLNYGFGANWWFRPRLGARIEYRDHVWRDNTYLREVRFGVAFR